MIHVELNHLSSYLEVDHPDQTAKFYHPWCAKQVVEDWLEENLQPSEYLVSHLAVVSYEQGIGQIPMFKGLRFTFDKVEDAMLFKLTFGGA